VIKNRNGRGSLQVLGRWSTWSKNYLLVKLLVRQSPSPRRICFRAPVGIFAFTKLWARCWSSANAVHFTDTFIASCAECWVHGWRRNRHRKWRARRLPTLKLPRQPLDSIRPPTANQVMSLSYRRIACRTAVKEVMALGVFLRRLCFHRRELVC